MVKPILSDVILAPPYLLTVIPFNKIYWSMKHHIDYVRDKNCRCCGGLRYEKADIRFPGIVRPYPKNTYGEIWITIDGCHRIQKMLDQGINEGLFFIIDGIDYTDDT